MMIEHLIERIVDTFIKEKTVPTSFQSKNPTILVTSPNKSMFTIDPTFKVKGAVSDALNRYKEDGYANINLTLRQHKKKLANYYEKYGMPRYYREAYQRIKFFDDLHQELTGKKKKFGIMSLPPNVRNTFAGSGSYGIRGQLEKLFNTFTWAPFETLDDAVVRDIVSRMVDIATEIVDTVQALTLDVKRDKTLKPQQREGIMRILKRVSTFANNFSEDFESKTQRTADWTFALSDALAHVQIKKDTVVFRAGKPVEVGLPERLEMQKAQKTKGQIVQVPNFMSTTTDIETTSHFSSTKKVMFIITIPAGMHCLPLDDLTDSYMGEDEILIHFNAKFRVDRIEDERWTNFSNQYIPASYIGDQWESTRVYMTMIDDGVTQ